MQPTKQRDNGPLLVSAVDAAGLLGVGRSLFYAMHSNGRLGPQPVKLGRRTLWRQHELTAWVEAGCPPRPKWVEMRN